MSLLKSQRSVLYLALALLLSSVGQAADVLQNVPGDAMAFVVVKDISAADAQVTRLLQSLQLRYAGPLAFLKATTGVSEGLDPHGDFLFAILLPGDAADGAPRFAVWLPVSDYDRLLRALGGTPGQQISGVAVSGEDVLVAHHGDWALVMDPDARQRMEQMLAAKPAPSPRTAAWKSWVDANSVTAIALTPGLSTVLSQIGEPDSQDVAALGPAAQADPFTMSLTRSAAPNDIFAMLRAKIRKSISASPKLYRLARQTTAVGCGLRLDGDGHAHVGVRIAIDEALPPGPEGSEDSVAPPMLDDGGDFIVYGAGRLPTKIAIAIASAYVQHSANELKSEERVQFDDAMVDRLQQAVAQAVVDLKSVTVLTKPGEKQDGVYTNQFAAVRVASATTFVDHAKEAMRLWNTMNLEAPGETRFIFDVEEVKLADRVATQYSLDIAALDGEPVLPEVRQAMEKFFGPGGKLRLFIVTADETTVLIAMATPEQVTAALKVLALNQKQPETDPRFQPVSQMLPPKRAWRLFFSPHHYNRWLLRQTEAMVGTEVIGGPLVKDFPPSPPVGIAGGFRDREAWADVAIPAQTIEAVGTYLRNKRTKTRIELQR